MEFSVLDKQTIQCVMTEAEIADYGMDKQSIYQNDERVADFFRRVMQKAKRETGFLKSGGNIAVHAEFLSDESLEITFFATKKELPLKSQKAEYAGQGQDQKADCAGQGQDQKADCARQGQDQKADCARQGQNQKADCARQGQNQKVEYARQGQDQKADCAGQGQDRKAEYAGQGQSREMDLAEQVAAGMETVVLKSKSLMHVVDFCKKAPAALEASLYRYRGAYFLLADVKGYGAHDTATLFNLADEYMDGVCYTKGIVAFIEEHGQCIIKRHAAAALMGL